MKYAVPRGTKDILPSETPLWQKVESVCRKVFKSYNCHEIRTPIFEPVELFTRSIGSSTDIVQKEMYTFQDRKGRNLALRPEETAPVVRACLGNNLIAPDQVVKLYYIGPMFRYERPQAGRQRQFHQAGVEIFGSPDPLADVETIMMNIQIFDDLGLKDRMVNLNSVGCGNCRPDYSRRLKEYFEDNLSHLCGDCRERFAQNPLRILDCKDEKCQRYIEKAPSSMEFLCPVCKGHYEKVKDLLGKQRIDFQLNPRLVRGLDYYTRTAFEIVARTLGAQNAVSGGGRYDTLVEELGGKTVPAIGFAIGLERVIEVLMKLQSGGQEEKGIDLFIAALGDAAVKIGFDILQKARGKGLSGEIDHLGKPLRAQMKMADRLGARKVIIIGEDEINKGKGVLRDMQTAQQQEIPFEEIVEVL